MTVTGTDIENDIESELVVFDVPILASADADYIRTNPSKSTSQTQLQVFVTNEGNGPQTYDVELSCQQVGIWD